MFSQDERHRIAVGQSPIQIRRTRLRRGVYHDGKFHTCSVAGTQYAEGHGKSMKTSSKLLVSAFILILLTLQIVAIIGPFDDWPFASNSMFGFYRVPGEPTYDIVILLEDEMGNVRQLDAVKDLGVPSADSFRRLVFSRWYGSVEPFFPQGKYPDDSRAAFAARLTDLSRKIVSVVRRRNPAASAITAVDIELRTMLSQSNVWVSQDRKPIGRYVVASDQFSLLTP